MKRLILSLLFMTFICPSLYAARTSVSSLIPSTTLDADPTAVSGSAKVKSADKIAFYVTYDETEVGGGLSVAVTCLISVDNSTWLAASFYDYAGGSTLQTSETLSANSSYYFWFNNDLAMPYVKVTLTATGSDADDTAIVTTQLITQE